MRFGFNFYFVIFFLCLNWKNVFVNSSSRLTNVQCKALDKPFANFRHCYLKMVRRGTAALFVHCELYQVPVNNVSIGLSLWKKESGYRPFLYNYTLDFCEFMKTKTRYPFVKIIFDVFLNVSNINHTCPYNHDIIVDKLVLKDDMFDRVPVPRGDYMVKLMVGAYNEWKSDIRIYLQLLLD